MKTRLPSDDGQRRRRLEQIGIVVAHRARASPSAPWRTRLDVVIRRPSRPPPRGPRRPRAACGSARRRSSGGSARRVRSSAIGRARSSRCAASIHSPFASVVERLERAARPRSSGLRPPAMSCWVWTKNSISRMPPRPSLMLWPRDRDLLVAAMVVDLALDRVDVADRRVVEILPPDVGDELAEERIARARRRRRSAAP